MQTTFQESPARLRPETADVPRMLRSAHEFLGYDIQALDGLVGHAEDLLFDDLSWTIRYLVADTGNLMPGTQVLVSPAALHTPIWESKRFPVALERARIQHGPHVSARLPVSRQHEEALVRAYGWPAYWTGFTPPVPGLDGSSVAAAIGDADHPVGRSRSSLGDAHLRRVKEVTGYTVHALDGKVGRIDDFVVETNTWTIHYLVINTRPWWFGGRVLIAPAWCDDVIWSDREAHVGLTREQIEHAPGYNPRRAVSRDYEQRLLDYYGRPKSPRS